MMYQKATVKNGKMEITEFKEIDQSKMTSDCFAIQFEGIGACKKCEFKNTGECGGGKTLNNMALVKKLGKERTR